MKKVNLKVVSKQTDKYFVFLGNGTAHQFTRDRDAQKFLSDTNDYLTHKLFEAHDIYSSVFLHYQNNWCYFRHDKPGPKAQFYNNDRTALRRLNDCMEAFNAVIDRCNSVNGNHFVFLHLRTALNNLKAVIQILNWLNESRSKRKELYAYRTLFDRILKVENDLNNYGQTTCVCIFRVPEHLEDSATEYIPKLAIA